MILNFFCILALIIHELGHGDKDNWESTFGFAWENNWHFATPPTVSRWNDVWEASAENSILMMHHYPDLGSASDWLKQISHTAQPIRGTTQKWLVTCHQYRISALVFQTSFRRETVGEIAKCWLFSWGTLHFWLKKLILFNVNLILTFSMYLQQM